MASAPGLVLACSSFDSSAFRAGVGAFVVVFNAGVVVYSSCLLVSWACSSLIVLDTIGRAVHPLADWSWYSSAMAVGLLLPFIFHGHIHRVRWWDWFVLVAFALVAFVLLSSLRVIYRVTLVSNQISCTLVLTCHHVYASESQRGMSS